MPVKLHPPKLTVQVSAEAPLDAVRSIRASRCIGEGRSPFPFPCAFAICREMVMHAADRKGFCVSHEHRVVRWPRPTAGAGGNQMPFVLVQNIFP